MDTVARELTRFAHKRDFLHEPLVYTSSYCKWYRTYGTYRRYGTVGRYRRYRGTYGTVVQAGTSWYHSGLYKLSKSLGMSQLSQRHVHLCAALRLLLSCGHQVVFGAPTVTA